jgi:hypothetical protein
MKNFKILVLALLCFGCVDQNQNKTNQGTDEVSLSNNTGFIKGVNHPYFIYTLISKNISTQEMVFFDDHLDIKNEKDILKNQYFIDLTKSQSKCCFKTVYTDVLQLKTKEYDLQIDFKKKEKIKFIGYKENRNEKEFYFKMTSLKHSLYLTIHKKISNKKFLFEITDYLKINDELL